jgi:hypothetical protein
MKKIILIIAFILICFQGKAQQEYDTIIYYPPAVLNCPMWMDSAELFNPTDPSAYYSILYHYELLKILCNYDVLLLGGNATIGPNDTNTLNIRAYAQPYHLDSTVLVIGVAAKVNGTKAAMSGYNYFRLMDSTKTEIAYVAIPWSGSSPNPVTPIQQTVQGKFYFNNQVMLKDFYIATDVPSSQEYNQGGSEYQFDHTVTFTDTSCLKIDRGCYQDEYPYFLKRHATQWTRFDQDTVYNYYRKMHIGFFPIILVPRPDTSSLVNDIDIDNTCNIIPNPAKDRLKVISQFKVKEIEIYNISGVKVKTIEINSYEKFVDISDLKAGTYIVKIHTPRGIATKKILVSR